MKMIKSSEIKQIHIELSSACNAMCPNCPRNVDGGYNVPWLKQSTMTFEDFTSIFSTSILKQIDLIILCGNYGDPMYCKDLPKILDYLYNVNENLKINMHTNGGVRTEKWWGDLARSNKNLSVTFSIDGLEDTNHIYRRGVVWKNLQNNFRSYIRNGGSAIWEMLMFKHNEHQIEIAKSFSIDEGFVKFIAKRAFGFEQNNTGFSNMRVLDQDGNLEYFIYEPTSDENKNSVWREKVANRADYSITKEIFKNISDRNLNDFDKIYQQHSPDYLDGTEIDCMSVDHKEIYVDSDGGVHPCCFLGMASQYIQPGLDEIQYYKWISKNIGHSQINAKIHKLEDIVDSNYFTMIAQTWKLSHKNGRIATCSKMCSKKKNQKDNLYKE